MRNLREDDLVRLHQFLLYLDNDEAMLLSELDGFLSALVVCPELVQPSEWLPFVWGAEGPVFDDHHEANDIIGLMMARFNEIGKKLGRKGKLQLLFDIDTDDTPLWEIWMEGFGKALIFRPGSWRVYDEAPDPAVVSAYRNMIALLNHGIGGEDLPDELRPSIPDHAGALIVGCLEVLNSARLDLENSRTIARQVPRVGRNDPCPCGSGKKFKKCCLQ